jgi:hypothetical protein
MKTVSEVRFERTRESCAGLGRITGCIHGHHFRLGDTIMMQKNFTSRRKSVYEK